MKKLVLFAVVAVFGMALVSCSKSKAPSETCAKALKCIQEKDWQGYVDLIHFSAEDSGDTAKLSKDRAMVLSTLKDKKSKEIEQKEGIKSFEITDEKIEDKKAVIKYKWHFNNGEEKDDEMKLCLDKNDDWRIDVGK